MQIALEQLWYPECAEDVPCALCKCEFRLGVVVARLLSDGEPAMDLGEVCPECALYLAAGPMGQARPEAFPNLEAFASRLEEWPGPVYHSESEMLEGLD